MANSPQAIKRARQNQKRYLHNKSLRSDMRTKVKHVLRAVAEGNKDVAATAFRVAASTLDSMARKRKIHPNKAARLKSRLNAKVKALAA